MEMLQNTNWNYPTAVWFGHGRVADIVAACEQMGMKHPLIVTDEALVQLPIMEDLLAPLKAQGLAYSLYSDVQPNPTGENVEAGVNVYREHGCDGVIAFGGGSALDAGKTIAFMSGQSLPLWDFEDIGDNWSRGGSRGYCKNHCDSYYFGNRFRGRACYSDHPESEPCQEDHLPSGDDAEFGDHRS